MKKFRLNGNGEWTPVKNRPEQVKTLDPSEVVTKTPLEDNFETSEELAKNIAKDKDSKDSKNKKKLSDQKV